MWDVTTWNMGYWPTYILSDKRMIFPLICCCSALISPDRLADSLARLYAAEEGTAGWTTVPPLPKFMTRHEKLLAQLCPFLNPVLAHALLARIPLARLFTQTADSLQAR